MIAPSSPDLVAALCAIAREAEACEQCDRAAVRGLNVRVEPIEIEIAERDVDRQRHAFSHQAAPGVRRERVVRERAATLRCGDHVVDLDDTRKCIRLLGDNEERGTIGASRAIEIFTIVGGGRCRDYDPAMQRAAAKRRVDEIALAARARAFEADAGSRYGSSSTLSCFVTVKSAGETFSASAMELAM